MSDPAPPRAFRWIDVFEAQKPDEDVEVIVELAPDKHAIAEWYAGQFWLYGQYGGTDYTSADVIRWSYIPTGGRP